jgi:hypothetical protein
VGLRRLQIESGFAGVQRTQTPKKKGLIRFRGGKPKVAKRFDKSDKNAPPIEFGMYKFTLEMLADGAPVLVSVFLDRDVQAEKFAASVTLKRGDFVAVAVNKIEMKNGVRRASCPASGFIGLEKAEAEQLRS